MLYHGHDNGIYTGYLGYTLVSMLRSECLLNYKATIIKHRTKSCLVGDPIVGH